jgi:hypothetical protein
MHPNTLWWDIDVEEVYSNNDEINTFDWNEDEYEEG